MQCLRFLNSVCNTDPLLVVVYARGHCVNGSQIPLSFQRRSLNLSSIDLCFTDVEYALEEPDENGPLIIKKEMLQKLWSGEIGYCSKLSGGRDRN